MILLNTANPESEETMEKVKRMEEQYGKSVLPVNCKEMSREDVFTVMEQILSDFPISRLNFIMPKWVEFLGLDNWLKADLVEQCRKVISKIHTMKDVNEENIAMETPYIKEIFPINSKSGAVKDFCEAVCGRTVADINTVCC